MKKILISLIVVGTLTGCSTGGRLVTGGFSYMHDCKLEQVVPKRTAEAKNLPLEVRVTGNGHETKAVAMVDLANLDGYKNMTAGEIAVNTGANIVDMLINYQLGKTAIHYGNEWFNDEEDGKDIAASTSASSVPDGDNVVINNTGNGRVDTDLYTVGQNRPTSITINNTGNGAVDLDVNKEPGE